MIRKTIIVVLTLGAVGMGVVWTISYRLPVEWKSQHVLSSGQQKGAVLATLVLKRTIAQGMIEAELYSDIPPGRDRIVDRESLATVDYTFALIRYRTRNDGQVVNDGFRTIVLYYQIATLHLPVWMPMVLFAAYPAVAFIRGPLRRWRRRRRGLCLKCGYDLTGNTTGRCSECGAAVGRA